MPSASHKVLRLGAQGLARSVQRFVFMGSPDEMDAWHRLFASAPFSKDVAIAAKTSVPHATTDRRVLVRSA
jgi:hypothetical protein